MTVDMNLSSQGNTIFVKGFGLTEKILQESFTKFGEFVYELCSRGHCYQMTEVLIAMNAQNESFVSPSYSMCVNQ